MIKQHYNPPELDAIADYLRQIHTIAVVGLSPKSKRPSYQVASAMQSYGYTIVPVRPGVTHILDELAYPSLRDVRPPVDLVNVFRAPHYVDEIVDTCIEKGYPALWLQDGVINEPAAARAQQAGLFVVMDRCLYRDYLSMLATSNAGE